MDYSFSDRACNILYCKYVLISTSSTPLCDYQYREFVLFIIATPVLSTMLDPNQILNNCVCEEMVFKSLMDFFVYSKNGAQSSVLSISIEKKFFHFFCSHGWIRHANYFHIPLNKRRKLRWLWCHLCWFRGSVVSQYHLLQLARVIMSFCQNESVHYGVET